MEKKLWQYWHLFTRLVNKHEIMKSLDCQSKKEQHVYIDAEKNEEFIT